MKRFMLMVLVMSIMLFSVNVMARGGRRNSHYQGNGRYCHGGNGGGYYGRGGGCNNLNYDYMVYLPAALAVGNMITGWINPPQQTVIYQNQSNDTNQRTEYRTREVRRFENGQMVGSTTTETIDSYKEDGAYYHR